MDEQKILLIVDSNRNADLAKEMRKAIRDVALANQHPVTEIELQRDHVPPCSGCLRCLTAHPGSCVYNECFIGLTREASECPVIVFLTPALFGTFSSTIKNVIDRGGLIIKNHRSCRQIIVGYDEEASDEERSTFIDIIAKHRGDADAVHPGVGERFEVYFARRRQDCREIANSLKDIV